MKNRVILASALIFSLVWNLLAFQTSIAATNTSSNHYVMQSTLNPTVSTHKLLVESSDIATLQQLTASKDATLLVDYGAFSLWRVPDTQAQSLSRRSSVSLRDDMDVIALRNGAFNTSSNPSPVVTANLTQARSQDYQFWLVQFVGPLKNEWLDNLRGLGIEPVIYIPNNAYVVWLNGASLSQLEGLAASGSYIQWTGPYQPAYRLAPSLQGQNVPLNQTTTVTIQFYNTANLTASLAKLQKLAVGQQTVQPHYVLNFANVTVQLSTSELTQVANWPDVFDVEPFIPVKPLDEGQDQIVADQIVISNTNHIAGGPGYLNWLASKGFPQTPNSYPIVAVIDTGLDNGITNTNHPDFHTFGISTTNSSRVIFDANCTTDPLADDTDGHGTNVAGIVAGYDNSASHVDTYGYNEGLGISPFGRIGVVKIFNDMGYADTTNCGGGYTDSPIVDKAYKGGASLTSNSWGSFGGGTYDFEAQEWDSLVRDASTTTPGNQQMLGIFAAGNDGQSGASTIDSPGVAKNVLTVGAADKAVASGDDTDNIAFFSSLGPTADGRVKPDIVAPGTDISSTGPTSDPNNPQFIVISGTSQATPSVSGAASLLYNYYGRVFTNNQTPSPAMLKVLLTNATRYLNGTGTGGNLPSNSQGWGELNMAMLFDGTPRFLLDQSVVFTNSGQSLVKTLVISDSSKPVRVSLGWTDAPGPLTANPYVNNLNLQVTTAGGQTYKGNVFNGAYSTTGGAFDTKNNLQSVFLPAGLSGAITVTVLAANIAGKADRTLSGNNQDFALVAYNTNLAPIPTTLNLTSTPNPSVVGQSVTFTATLNTSAASGNITFTEGSTVLNTATLLNGVASFSTSNLSVGTHNITATYSGDSFDLSSTSNVVIQVINANILSTANGNCNEPGLNAALKIGGYISVQCPPNTTITVTANPDTSTNYRSINISATLDASPSVNFAISGGGNYQIFTVNSGANFTINNLTLSNGKTSSGGGAIYTNGTLTITNVAFTSNNAQYGGAIYNDSSGIVTLISNSTFYSNTASTSGGAINNYIGTINSIISTTFSYNTATTGVGGALNNDFSGSTHSISNSLFYSNTTSIYGGAIYNDGSSNITNTTFYGNYSQNAGGAVYVNHQTTSLINVTFVANGASGNSAASILNAGSATINMANSQLALATTGNNCYGVINDEGYNLNDDNSCSFSATGSQNNVTNLNLGPLASNGGSTQTVLPGKNSAAIDAIPNGTNGCGTTITNDQRGYTRP